MYLGLDIAQVNFGFAVFDGESFLSCRTHKTPDHLKTNIQKNAFQEKVLRSYLESHKFDAICVEAPAMSAKFGAVSIGMIHGAVHSVLIGHGVPFLWLPPTKTRYAMLSSAKAPKNEGILFCKNNFIFEDAVSPRDIDENAADAAMFAYLAASWTRIQRGTFQEENFIGERSISSPKKTVCDRVLQVFNENTGKGAPEGILHRPFEFYWTPELHESTQWHQNPKQPRQPKKVQSP